MPLYLTVHESKTVGTYNAQRPSVAACKAFTTLKRSNATLEQAFIEVQTEGKKNLSKFKVEYMQVEDKFLGLLHRPIATKA